MALPINIEDLLKQRKVESNRIEFKTGWNPDKIYRTICAFATDFENMGGGYILVGVEQDENGMAKRPVKGIPLEAVDGIMKDIVNYDTKISPSYLTKVSLEEVDGKHILAIWAPVGIHRPYCVAENVTVKKSPQKYYVRSKSSTIEAKGEILDQVRELAVRVPFDCRGNFSIKSDDIDFLLIREYLERVKSRMVAELKHLDTMEVLERMDLITGPAEEPVIKNVAAMMFSNHPEKFFPRTQISVVIFPEGVEKNPNRFIEKTFNGSVPTILRSTLQYLKDVVVTEYVSKPKDRAESDRWFNYPYQALEEAVVNSMYHRDYQEQQEVEITVEPDGISILSLSGPDRSISDKALKECRQLRARRYRNNRLGDFLKELELTEGRSTGIPTIQDELQKNGSPRASIETDEDRSYFLMFIPVHEGCGEVVGIKDNNGENNNGSDNLQASLQGKLQDNLQCKLHSKLHDKMRPIAYDNIIHIVEALIANPNTTILELSNATGLSVRTIKSHLAKLRDAGIIERIGSNKTGSWQFIDYKTNNP